MTGQMQAAACYGEMRVPAVPDRNGGEYGAIPLAWLCILRQKYWGALNQGRNSSNMAGGMDARGNA
jgi:hypothetical protein